jgi:hypothetical protein
MGLWSKRVTISAEEQAAVTQALENVARDSQQFLYHPIDVAGVTFDEANRTLSLTVSLPPSNQEQGKFLSFMSMRLDVKPTKIHSALRYATEDAPSEDAPPAPAPEAAVGDTPPPSTTLEIPPSFLTKRPVRVTMQDATTQEITVTYRYTPELARNLGVQSSLHTHKR